MSQENGKSKITIQINEEDHGSTTEIELSQVQNILREYQEDIFDYNRKLEKHRLGKVLTIIDSAVSDETQRKAVKDLVHDAWYSSSVYIEGHSGHPQLRLVTEAIGFDLYSQGPLLEAPSAPVEEYNKYKHL